MLLYPFFFLLCFRHRTNANKLIIFLVLLAIPLGKTRGTTWCDRRDLNPRPADYAYHFDFRRPLSRFVVWTIPCLSALASSLYTFLINQAWLGIGMPVSQFSVPRICQVLPGCFARQPYPFKHRRKTFSRNWS